MWKSIHRGDRVNTEIKNQLDSTTLFIIFIPNFNALASTPTVLSFTSYHFWLVDYTADEGLRILLMIS